MDVQEKVRENAARRHAKRLGLELVKSRARLRHVDDHQGYQIQDPGVGILAGDKFALTLKELETYLNKYEHRLRSA